jgi:UDP-N-acetylglucosamine--N-acetylmuramyl-(pentapeptide) pyrophosphoryl-undecaprenol N-acetylglucosamine transferase
MKVCIIGGHLSPALAVMDALEDANVIFIGRKYTFEADKTESLEYKTVTKRTIPFYHLQTGRVQRKLTTQTIPSLLRVPKGFFQAVHILQKEKPDIVMGFGGYVSLPVCFAAYVLRIPIIIHEQTLGAGLANKVIGKIATKICISFPSSKAFFPTEKVMLTGNPLRKEIIEVKKQKKKTHRLPLIFITGGSTGSQAVNRLVAEILPELLHKTQVIHQTGAANNGEDSRFLENMVKGLSQSQQENYQLHHFISPQEMAEHLHQADLVISRSGMNTTTELLYLEKPSLLIPLPYGQSGEQLQNARFLKSQNLAEIGDQNSIMKEEFLEKIMLMLDHLSEYTIKDETVSRVHEKAAEHITHVIHDVYKKKKTA